MANKKTVKKITTKKHLAREHREAKQTRLILIISIVVGTIILGLVAYGIIDQTIVRPNKPVAQVGDTEITVREFEKYVRYTRVQMLNQSFQYYSFYQQFGEFGESFLQTAQSLVTQLTQPIALGRDVLDEMIDNQIIRDEAAKRGITVSQEEIDEAIRVAFGFFPDGTPTPTVTATVQPTPTYSETQLALITSTSTPTEIEPENTEESTNSDGEEEAVSEAEETEVAEAEPTEVTETPEEPAQANADQELTTPEPTPTVTLTPTVTITPTPYTTALFAQNIREFNNSYSPYNFDIDDLRSLFEVQLLRDKLTEVMTQDLVPFKDEAWARHILVETQEEALEVLSRLEAGEDFQTLAETYSIDESNREQGGDLGWFDENTMVPAFSEVAFSLSEGEISEPVETEFGFHIIQNLGKRVSQILPEEFEQRRQTAFSEWLVEQRSARDDIVIFDTWENFVPTTPDVPQQFLAELFQQPQQ
jgi:parvulin-like peptidyl-prolyl isomerase